MTIGYVAIRRMRRELMGMMVQAMLAVSLMVVVVTTTMISWPGKGAMTQRIRRALSGALV